MVTRYTGVLAKDLQGEDRNAVLFLMGRARLLVGRALRELKFANKQQVHLRERQTDGALIHAMATNFGAGAPIHKVWIEVPPKPVSEPEIPILPSGVDLFFWQDKETGARWILNLFGALWRIREAPDYIEYGTVEDEKALSQDTFTWVGNTKKNILVWSWHNVGLYGYAGAEIVPPDVEVQHSGYSGGGVYKGVPIVIELETSEAWAVRGKDKADWESLGFVIGHEEGGREHYPNITFNQAGDKGIGLVTNLPLDEPYIVVRVELTGSADSISMNVTEDTSAYNVDRTDEYIGDWIYTTVVSSQVWEIGFWHDEEVLYIRNTDSYSEKYRGGIRPRPDYESRSLSQQVGMPGPTMEMETRHVQNDDFALGHCVSFTANGLFTLQTGPVSPAQGLILPMVMDQDSCPDTTLVGTAVDVWVDGHFGMQLKGDRATLETIAYTNDVAVAVLLTVFSATPGETGLYFLAYHDGVVTDLTGEIEGATADMVNLCSLRGKV